MPEPTAIPMPYWRLCPSRCCWAALLIWASTLLGSSAQDIVIPEEFLTDEPRPLDIPDPVVTPTPTPNSTPDIIIPDEFLSDEPRPLDPELVGEGLVDSDDTLRGRW